MEAVLTDTQVLEIRSRTARFLRAQASLYCQAPALHRETMWSSDVRPTAAPRIADAMEREATCLEQWQRDAGLLDDFIDPRGEVYADVRDQ